MKTNNDIEKQFEKLKTAYQVPDDYFQSLETKILKKKKPAKVVSIRKYTSKLMVAAGITLLLSLGYIKLTQYKNLPVVHPSDSLHISRHLAVDPLSDISDDEILEYLDDNMDVDDLVTDNFNL